ncbi:MAG: type I-B CRISPR-associated protein Cas7/Cst2/DevR [candidate division KSB1 bacterium]|nr:type I-B CRISPR-associated protein Cas7/Cst2/DevR [candidate division KSB1 bacterium]MDZ7274615.1 type I-B CRISPR-associated protein Cas7/Cst2/DevR [candidate division KSB1 bacterium]MDZ7285440.1 type I-B CRISPR-associated protein Cas7/Cst2/DevR [candidate division KSB1 bacterium]MDZ7298472.1 type I-B CRISPR-associated protein Cas7/Cst2/DevR [candidate division KSB1 bacterium]MDZ7306956.1 type I-B CRISPR-associated protein Cas7/Cst2/DevR [candidate division KSB1 bacterium]
MKSASKPNCLTITWLAEASLASFNAGDKEADNLVSLKKITRQNGQYVYISGQAVRRALRDRLEDMGEKLSLVHVEEGQDSKQTAHTQGKPAEFIDDDLFGFMIARKGQAESANKRTAPVRVAPMMSLTPWQGETDFGANFSKMDVDGKPNLFETEIDGGYYRGTVLVELDRIGCDEGYDKPDAPTKRVDRVQKLLKATRDLWLSGRQSRFLGDLTPKIVAAALMTAKVPLFLEAIFISSDGKLNLNGLAEAALDRKDIIVAKTFGGTEKYRPLIPPECEPVTIGEAFEKMSGWITTKLFE